MAHPLTSVEDVSRPAAPTLGVVVSAGGAAFRAAAQIIGRDAGFVVLASQPEAASGLAGQPGIKRLEVPYRDRASFSRDAARALLDAGASSCLLYFDRLVGPELYEGLPTYNIHPSALPSFAGLAPVAAARAARTRILGCTLHRVDATVDGGPIVAQTACGADPGWPQTAWDKRAFLMKVYCGLVWTSLMQGRGPLGPRPSNASHAIPEPWMAGFHSLQADEAVTVLS